MDIRQWLEETADRAPPDQEADVGLPAFLQPHPEPEAPTHKYRRRKKQPSADSSIIEARHPKHPRHKAAGHAHSPDQAGRVEASFAKSRSSQSSRSSAFEEIPQKAFEKRARHKTRSDRYQPKSKERHRKGKKRKESEERDDRHSKPKRRKSHRSGDGGRTSGLVQSFELRNGPKNNRLTVRSLQHLGTVPPD